MEASNKGRKEVVKLLLDHGADTNMQDRVSVTDMIYMRDVYVMYVYVCVYDCMINVMIVCLFVQMIVCISSSLLLSWSLF